MEPDLTSDVQYSLIARRKVPTRQVAQLHGLMFNLTLLIKGKLRIIAQDLRSAKIRITDILSENKIQNEEDIARGKSYVHTLRIFEVELFCQLQDWKHVFRAVQVWFVSIMLDNRALILPPQELETADALAVDTFESIADILVCACCDRLFVAALTPI
jgi:hypothetical protein